MSTNGKNNNKPNIWNNRPSLLRVLSQEDPIVRRERHPRTSVTTETSMWKDFMGWLEDYEAGKISLGPKEMGIGADFNDPAIRREFEETAKRMDTALMKNPVYTFQVRFRRWLRDAQQKSERLRELDVITRGSEIAIVGKGPI